MARATAKVYRISVKNASNGDKRELLWEKYATSKKAHEVAERINIINPSREAIVLVK